MKRAAALLITLIIVSSLGVMALVAVSSTMSSLIYNVKTSDQVIADEASLAGIELYLSPDDAATRVTSGTLYCDLSLNLTKLSACSSSSSMTNDKPYAEVTVDTSDPAKKQIISVGHFGGTARNHLFQIENLYIQQVY